MKQNDLFSYLCTSIYAKSRLNRRQRYQHPHIRQERQRNTESENRHEITLLEDEIIEFILKRIEEHTKLRKLFI